VLSAREERVVRNDNTVGYHNLTLQLPPSRYRVHFVRCPVTVHQFSDGKLGVSYQGRLLARYDRGGELLHPTTAANKVRAASVQPPGQPTDAVPAAATHWQTRTRRSHFSAHTPQASKGAGGKMSISQTANSTPGGDSPCPSATPALIFSQRTSLNVYAPDIFKCSGHFLVNGTKLLAGGGVTM
jgi:hypothetical protein